MMQPTNELRFVKRVIEPGDLARTALILQQKWAGPTVSGWAEEWRDVPVEEE